MGEQSARVRQNSSSKGKPILFVSTNQKLAPESGPICGSLKAPLLSKRQLQHQQVNHQQRQQQKQEPQDARLQQIKPRMLVASARLRSPLLGQANSGSNNNTQWSSSLCYVPSCNCTRKALLLVAASIVLLAACASSVLALAEDSVSSASLRQQQQQSVADGKATLEAELNAILQQQQEFEQENSPNSKLLSEAIISRLMLGNLTDISGDDVSTMNSADEGAAEFGLGESSLVINQQEAQRLRRILNYLQNYELAQASRQNPVLPVDQAATIKRASMKMGNYLRHQAQGQHAGQRQLNGYGRVNSFDFGLGKRPDSSAGAGNILRFGDSSASAGGHLTPVSGLGKRPSAHRYDFGLGKRVASPAYPRYDFGLGKRAPSNRIRYDFGLGK